MRQKNVLTILCPLSFKIPAEQGSINTRFILRLGSSILLICGSRTLDRGCVQVPCGCAAIGGSGNDYRSLCALGHRC